VKADHSLKAGSSCHALSVGSLNYAAVKIPLALLMPAGLSTEPTEAEMLLRRWIGFQPISALFLIAWAADFCVVTSKKTSAPEASFSKAGRAFQLKRTARPQRMPVTVSPAPAASIWKSWPGCR
jgi:hypothetical protein